MSYESLGATHAELVTIESAIRDAARKDNTFLAELVMPPIPGV